MKKSLLILLLSSLMLTGCGDKGTEGPHQGEGSQEHEEATLVSIYIKNQPTKTTYYIGQTFSPAGMVVQAKYSDNTEKSIDDYTYSTAKFTTAGTIDFEISFGGKKTTVELIVKASREDIDEQEYTATISLHGSRFATDFKEGTNFDKDEKFQHLLEYIDEQLDYYDLINKIECVKCTSRKVDGDTFFQIGTGSPAKGKFNEGTFNWTCKEKIYRVEITAFNYSNPYQDYTTGEIVHNVDNLGHLILDDIDTSFEIASDAEPITKKIVKEYAEGVTGFQLKATGGRMLVSEMKITWRG